MYINVNMVLIFPDKVVITTREVQPTHSRTIKKSDSFGFFRHTQLITTREVQPTNSPTDHVCRHLDPISQMVKSLHYSFGERRPPSDPLEAESPHVTFPLYRVMDWFVVTPEGEKRRSGHSRRYGQVGGQGTIDRQISLWNCLEYITCSRKMKYSIIAVSCRQEIFPHTYHNTISPSRRSQTETCVEKVTTASDAARGRCTTNSDSCSSQWRGAVTYSSVFSDGAHHHHLPRFAA